MAVTEKGTSNTTGEELFKSEINQNSNGINFYDFSPGQGLQGQVSMETSPNQEELKKLFFDLVKGTIVRTDMLKPSTDGAVASLTFVASIKTGDSVYIVVFPVAKETATIEIRPNETGFGGILPERFIDMDLIAAITTLLRSKKAYGPGVKIVPKGAIMIQAIPDVRTRQLFALGINELGVATTSSLPVLSQAAIRNTKEWSLRLFPTSVAAGIIARHTTWKTSLWGQRTAIRTVLNSQETILSEVSGYLDFVPVTMEAKIVGATREVVVFPIVVINSITTNETSTLAELLTSLYFASTTVEQDANWHKIVTANPVNDIGGLNKIINVYGTEVPEPVEVSNKSLSTEESSDFLSKLVTGGMSVVIETDTFGFNNGFEIFIAAAGGDTAAQNKIVQTLHYLTNGIFPSRFDPREIMIPVKKLLPRGTVKTRDGIKPLEVINIPYMMRSNDPRVPLWEGVYSRSVTLETNTSSFDELMAMYKEMGLEATIEGTKTRGGFTGKFMLELRNAFHTLGMKPKFKSYKFNQKGSGYATYGSNLRAATSLPGGELSDNTMINSYNISGNNIGLKY